MKQLLFILLLSIFSGSAAGAPYRVTAGLLPEGITCAWPDEALDPVNGLPAEFQSFPIGWMYNENYDGGYNIPEAGTQYEPLVLDVDGRTTYTIVFTYYNYDFENQSFTLVYSPGTFCIFENLQMPEGAELYIYDLLAPGNSIGPYTTSSNGSDLVTDMIGAKHLAIEYSVPTGTSPGNLWLHDIISAVPLYQDGNPVPAVPAHPGIPEPLRPEYYIKDPSDFGRSHADNVNINCDEAKAWSNERDAVVILAYQGIPVGTGALINNPDEDGMPYVVTAAHVALHFKELYPNFRYQDLEFIFNYQSTGCENGQIPDNYGVLIGAYEPVIHRDYDLDETEWDFAVFRLLEKIPDYFHVSYLGWDARWSINIQSPVVIHHPAGDIKKIGFSDDTFVSSTTTSPYNIPGFQGITLSSGYIEGGTSGSPLLNGNHSFIGNAAFIIEGNYSSSAFFMMMQCYDFLPDQQYQSFLREDRGPYIANHDYDITGETFDATVHDNLGAGFFRTMKSIWAGDNVTVRNTEVKFCAANSVTLTSGFRAEAGCIFTAKTFTPGQNYDYIPAANVRSDFTLAGINGIAPSSDAGPIRNQMDIAFTFDTHGSSTKKVSTVEYSLSDDPYTWVEIPVSSLSGDIGLLPGNNIDGSPAGYTVTWATKDQMDGQDNPAVRVRVTLEDQSGNSLYSQTAGPVHVDNKNIHVWSGGDNSDGLTWATAYTGILTADNHATDHGYVIRTAAETFAPAGYPHKITPGYDMSWQGGYSGVETAETFRESPRDGFTRFIAHSQTGPGSKDKGLFTTDYKLYVSRFEILNDGASYVASNYGAVRKLYSFTNCVFNGGGYVLFIRKSGGLLYLTNCTLSGVSRVSYNTGSGLRTSIHSCILDDMGEVHKYATGTVNAEYSIFELSAQTPPDGTGVLQGDALLADPAGGDFHVTASSPAIDGGDPAADCTYEPSPNGGVINMGAYGNTSEAHTSGFTLLSINGTAPSFYGDDNYTVEPDLFRNGMDMEFVFRTHGGNTKKISTVEYSLSDNPFVWEEIPVSSLAGDVGLLPGNNISGTPASYTVTWATRHQLGGQDNPAVRIRVSLEDQSGNPLYSLTAGPLHVDNKNIHVWSGGDNSDGLTWATAFTDILTADNYATGHGCAVRVAAETFSPGGEPHKITPGHDQEWQGGYSGAASCATYRESPQDGFTRFHAHSLTGPGSKSFGLFTTDYDLIINRFEIFNDGASYIASNRGAVNTCFTLTNCLFYGGGYVIYANESNSIIDFTNCTLYDVYRAGYNDRHLTVNMNSCIIDDMGEVIKFTDKGTVNATYCLFDVDYQTPPSGTGNIITEDPLFIDAGGGDMHLAHESPAIDGGDPAYSFCLEPGPGGGRLNMGAYGNTQEAAASDPSATKTPPGSGGQGEVPPLRPGTENITVSPNPFRSSTQLSYTVRTSSAVKLTVYDFNGGLVKILVDNRMTAAGQYQVRWNGTDRLGKTVKPGIYYYELNANGTKEMGRVISVR